MKIPNVSLTYFVDFVLKSGTPKLTVVETFKDRPDYHPVADFYKPLRDRLVEVAQGSLDAAGLVAWAGTVDRKKKAAYVEAAAGFKKFIGRKQHTWSPPPKSNYVLGPISINVNPEIGFTLAGQEHAVKLYLKDEPLAKNRAQVILCLMDHALSDPNRTRTFGVLDVRKGRLHAASSSTSGLAALLAGEASSFATIYASL